MATRSLQCQCSNHRKAPNQPLRAVDSELQQEEVLDMSHLKPVTSASWHVFHDDEGYIADSLIMQVEPAGSTERIKHPIVQTLNNSEMLATLRGRLPQECSGRTCAPPHSGGRLVAAAPPALPRSSESLAQTPWPALQPAHQSQFAKPPLWP